MSLPRFICLRGLINLPSLRFVSVRTIFAILFTTAALNSAYAQNIAQPELTTKKIQVGMYIITAEIAASNSERQMGLMHRATLGPNRGMLFVSDQPDKHCFWMRNTPLALTIAWLDEQGRIVSLADMQPKSDTNHCPTAPAVYALEMEQGWFKQRNIKAGVTLKSDQLFKVKSK